ncbi:hypothetical protein LINGRAHAP2_LOCUS11081 [Linum grandiflorum]
MEAGVVVRDDAGTFKLASVHKTPGEWQPDLAEAITIEFRLQTAKQHQFCDIIIESDCLDIVQQVQEMGEDLSEIRVICRSIRRLLDEFDSAQIQHCSREDNKTAHIMAHSEARWNYRVEWVDRPPIYIVYQLILDNVTVYSEQ